MRKRINNKTIIGIMILFGSMISVQLGSVVGKSLFQNAEPVAVALARYLPSAIALLLISRPRIKQIPKAIWKHLLALGICMVIMNISFYYAISFVPVGVGVTIEVTGPLVLALVQIKRLRELIWVLFALIGVGLIGVQSVHGALDMRGVLLAMLAGAAWAGYIFFTSRVGKAVPGLAGLAISMTLGALIILPFGVGLLVGAVARNPHIIWPMLLVSMFSSLIGYGLEMASLRRIPMRVFSVFMSLEPAIATIMGAISLGERIEIIDVLALVCVAVASIGIVLSKPKEEKS